jgi:hypothetical protein
MTTTTDGTAASNAAAAYQRLRGPSPTSSSRLGRSLSSLRPQAYRAVRQQPNIIREARIASGY